MKTLQQIKDEVSKEKGFDNYNHACEFVNACTDEPSIEESGVVDEIAKRYAKQFVDKIAKRYARECCKSTLEKAAENVSGLDGIREEVYDSITNEDNIVLL